MRITDLIIETVMDKVGIEQSDIDKTKEILDMVSFTKEDGKDIILVKIGENVEVKITK
tara:strand:- start:1145 stop:1318 length:174 start_codon:yes stop_codon:yes gene_type:complete